MKRIFTSLLCALVACSMYGQDIQNMELLSNVTFNESGNDIWGFVDSVGTEYAVIGTRTATRIFSLEDPTAPIERYVVTGASSTWRDIKEVDGYLYVTTDEGADGLTIINVRNAHKQEYAHKLWQPTLNLPNGSGVLERIHNIYADTKTGIIYLSGHNISGTGVIIADVRTSPEEPIYLSAVDQYYSHDSYVLDDVLYSSELEEGFAMYDVSDPTNPVEIGRQLTTREFTHNAWISEDTTVLYTTDERSNAYLESYDVSDPMDIRFLDKFQPLKNSGTRVIPHNTHTLGKYAITSWYTDGVIITDMSKPDNIVQVAQYDTYFDEANLPPTGLWFSGCWGAYPYLPSGLILASDIESGLFVFRATYKRACYLEGKVTSGNDSNFGEVISGAKVELLEGDLAFDNTDIRGEYKTGLPTAGTYRVAFTHPSYISDTLEATLVNGEVTILNAQLRSAVLLGKVIDTDTREPIEGASVIMEDVESGTKINLSTDANGSYAAPVRTGSEYDIYVGKWGYLHQSNIGFGVNELEVSADFELAVGYQDDYFADLGWTIDGNASTGQWEIGKPEGTFLGTDPSNPSEDVVGDYGNDALVTGNGTQQVGANDIDDGITRATSPTMDWSKWGKAEIDLSYWFVNAGGQGSPLDDSLTFIVQNGSNSIMIDQITASGGVWVDTTYTIVDTMIDFTSEMQLVAVAGDYGEGHIVEAGVDKLFVEGFPISNTDVLVTADDLVVSPNPTANFVTFETDAESQVTVTDIKGQILISKRVDAGSQMLDLRSIPAGSYLLSVHSEKSLRSQRVIRL